MARSGSVRTKDARDAVAGEAGPSPLRCAVYTRKSSEEGLDQAFNSLDAQREACEAYVKSQAHEGWVLIPTFYDDGGFSGGSMERPALKALLGDIALGKVDVVAVYKIDRLTRSLGDFGRIVEVFDKAGASFVSITQAFNTTTSMGRLTLNVLLSFAQFEREVTGERIRDKIAQSKAKGMWMGGNVLLGYDLKDRQLHINLEEAERVRHIYTRYLKLGSVHRLKDELEAEGIRSKAWTSLRGTPLGGQIFSRGALYHLLRNRHYLGEIVHKGAVFPGQHQLIVDRMVFDAVQALLAEHCARSPDKSASRPALLPHRLTGRLFDAEGDAMSPTTSIGRGGKRHRYYVSAPLQHGEAPSGSPSLGPRRLAASAVEDFLLVELQRLTERPNLRWDDLNAALVRVDARPASTELVLDLQHLSSRDHPALALSALKRRLQPGEEAVVEAQGDKRIRVRLTQRLQFRGGARGKSGSPLARPMVRHIDVKLVQALHFAHKIAEGCAAGPLQASPSPISAPPNPYQRRVYRLAFLAPDLQLAILQGLQPRGVTLASLIGQAPPLDWNAQRRWWRGMEGG